MKVCRYESGNTDLFTCPYHAWAYGLDGKLRGVPHDKLIYDGGIDRDAWGLEVFVRNATDERGEVFVNGAAWDKRITTNRPRTFGLRTRFRF